MLVQFLIEVLCTIFVHSLHTCSLLNTQKSSFSAQSPDLYPQTDIQKDEHKARIYLLGLLKKLCNFFFLTIFDIFSRDRQTDRQTDKGRNRSSELKMF